MEVLTVILYSLKDISVLSALCCILHFFFHTDIRKNKIVPALWVAFIVIYTVIGGCLLPKITDLTYEYLDGFSFLMTELALFVILKKPPKTISVCLGAIYIFTIDMLWSFLSVFSENSLIAELIFNIIISVVILFAVNVSSKKMGNNIFAGVFQEIPRWIIFVLLFFEVTCYYREFGISTRWYDFFYAVSACMIFVCILYLVYKIFSLVYTQNSILQRLNEQLAFSEISSKSDADLRAFRHDYKNHLIVLNSMFEQGEYERAKKYFNVISGSISEHLNSISTGNSVVNSLLAVKKEIALSQNTEIIFDGIIPQYGIENNDMCTIVGNLLDNALEACEKLPKDSLKQITIHSHVKNNFLFLSITNPITHSTHNTSTSLLPRTTKKDTRLHGFGLKNVNSVAEKYNGSFSHKITNAAFSAELTLQLRSENSNS